MHDRARRGITSAQPLDGGNLHLVLTTLLLIAAFAVPDPAAAATEGRPGLATGAYHRGPVVAPDGLIPTAGERQPVKASPSRDDA